MEVPIRPRFEPRTKPLRMGEEPPRPFQQVVGMIRLIAAVVVILFAVVQAVRLWSGSGEPETPLDPEIARFLESPPFFSAATFWTPSEAIGTSLFLEWSRAGEQARRHEVVAVLDEEELIRLDLLWNNT